jgi:predicted permease
MSVLRAWFHRFCNLFRKERLDRELDAELASHLEMHIEDNLRAGFTPEEARRVAFIKLGGIEQTRESHRYSRGIPLLEGLLQDLRFALRSLQRNRGLSFVSIFALALGIGATTVMFSVVYNVFFDPLPYKNFNRYVVFAIQNLASVGGWKGRDFFSPQEVRAFREQNHVFEDVIVHNGCHVLYDDGKFVRHWPRGEEVTTNTFQFLGVPPLLGRTFSEEDGRPAAPPVFIMNYRLWQDKFAADPKILNTVFILAGKSRTLIGIMPRRFNFFGASFWLPMSDSQTGGSLVGRLKPGVSVQTAGADLDAIAHALQKTYRSEMLPDKFAIVPQTLLDSIIGGFRKTLYALLASVLLLLLIACSNVANLLLLRATVRDREIAMRAALGASRARLSRQLLLESFVLASFASFAGCALAYLALKVVVALIPAGALPEEVVIRLNTPILFAVAGLALLTTVLCGLAPVLHVMSADLQSRLTGSGKNVEGHFRHGRMRAALVVGEVALSLVLLIGAGLLMRSFFILTQADLGFDPQNVLYFRPTLTTESGADDATRQKKNAMTRQLLDHLRALPGVTSVSESMLEPPIKYDWSDTIIPGKPHTERWETRFEICSEGYFQILGLPLLHGRLLSEDDMNAQRHVMVVNETFSRQYFPGEDPIGHQVKLQVLDRPFLDAPHDTYFEIVGMVRDYKTRDEESRSWRAFPQVFIPYSVQGFSYRTYMARTVADPRILLKNIEQEVRAIDPGAELESSGTLAGSLQEFYQRPQFELFTLGAFAVIGLLLVVIGIFSVVAYTVSRQTHELGIRIALGAQRTDILGMVFTESLRIITSGVVIGLLASYGFSRFLTSEISGISVSDPWTYGLVTVVVVGVGLLACYLPARRATRVDPLVALRYE